MITNAKSLSADLISHKSCDTKIAKIKIEILFLKLVLK